VLPEPAPAAHLPAVTPSASPTRGALIAIGLTTFACALFSLLDSGTKYSGMHLPVAMVVYLRFLAQALTTAALVVPRHGFTQLRTRNLPFQLARSVTGFLTTVGAFFCIQNMPLANFTAIWASAPLLLVVASALVFGERVSPMRWLLLVIGMLAVLLIIRPESDAQSSGWDLLWPVAVLLSGTTYQLLGSRLAHIDPPATTQIYTTWLPVLLTTPFIAFFWEGMPTWQLWCVVAVMGICSGLGHLLLLHAFSKAPTAIVSPFLYSQIGFAMLLGWLFFGQIPDALSLAGMATIVVCGLIGLWLGVREKR
jgi:drug/metabolite transporter (DMT)-like permease